MSPTNALSTFKQLDKLPDNLYPQPQPRLPKGKLRSSVHPTPCHSLIFHEETWLPSDLVSTGWNQIVPQEILHTLRIHLPTARSNCSKFPEVSRSMVSSIWNPEIVMYLSNTRRIKRNMPSYSMKKSPLPRCEGRPVPSPKQQFTYVVMHVIN